MLLSTAAFVIGVSVERNQGHSESSVEDTHAEESESHQEGESESEESESHSEESETIAGIDAEGTPIIVLGVALSLALAGAVLRWPRRELFAVAAVFCLGFAALDARELLHQLDEGADGVAALAAIALLLHLGAGMVAAVALTRLIADRTESVAA